MKKLSDCMSPLGWIFAHLAIVPPFILLLRPGFLELVVVLVIDNLVFWVNRRVEGKVFKKLYPETALYFDGLESYQVRELSLEQRISLFESFTRFPRRRALFCYLGSFVKILPAVCLIVFYWEHPERSNWLQFGLIMGSSLVTFGYLYGTVFIEAHIFLSELVEKLHQELDLNPVFEKAKISYSRLEFEIQEIATLVFIIVFTLGLQWLVVATGQYRSTTELSLKLVSIGAMGLIFFVRIWYLGRKFFIGGLEKLFGQMVQVDYRNFRSSLALHTAPLLAQFERTFNLLMERLRGSEQELSYLVLQQAEKSRYKALGEMSALIAHDLSGPMHVVQYCAERLSEDLGQAPTHRRYVEQLSLNTTRAIELISSLRARLKNSDDRPSETLFHEAHTHVVRLLGTQFHMEEFNRIRFSVDTGLDSIRLKMSRVDLIHVLDNLYRNSVSNLIQHAIHDPAIILMLQYVDNQNAEILMKDNGTGLSRESFEKLTQFQFMKTSQEREHKGLGLRLTRRLVELNHGLLQVIEDQSWKGTIFSLKLPISREGVIETVRAEA